jgi:PAS domain S-box-containing protein/putative nucleotidyltransferase with HDIG domain
MNRPQKQDQESMINLLGSMMDFLLDEIVLIDSNGEILWVNQAWRDFARENDADAETREGVGLNYFEICRKAVQRGDLIAQEVLRGLQEVSQGERTEFVTDYPCQTPRGELWFKMRAIPFYGGNYVMISHHDCSARVHAEHAYHTESDRFYSLINSMADIIFLLDTEGRHVGVYGQWLEKYALSPEMFLGKAAREILGDEAAKVHEQANQRALAGENVIYEWSYQDQNGEHVIQTHLSPLRGLDGRIQGIVGVGRDLTERVKIEHLMEVQTENLKRLNELAAYLQGLQTPEEVYKAISQQVAEILSAPKALIAIRDREADLLIAQLPAYGFTLPELNLFRFSVSEGQKIWDFDKQGSLLANRPEDLPEGFRAFAQALNCHSVLAVQVDVREHMGGLILAANKANGFNEQDRQMLELIARQAGGVLTRLQLYQRLQAQLNELQVLQLVSACGVQAESEDELIASVTQIVGDTLYPDNFGVLLFSQTWGGLKPHPSYRGATPAAMQGVYHLGEGSIAGMVAQTRRALRIDDVTQEKNYFPANPLTRSELCVPLLIGEEILGVLNVESKEIKAFSRDDERLMSTIAGLLASAMLRLRRAESERYARRIAESLLKTAHSLSSELETEGVLQRIFESLGDFVNYRSATIVWMDRKPKFSVLHSTPSLASDETWVEFAQRFLEADTPETQWIEIDPGGAIRTCEDFNEALGCSGIVSPLSDHQLPRGILALEGVKALPWDEKPLQLVTAFAEQAGLSFQNSSLYAQAIQDSQRQAALHRASQQLIEAGYDFEAIYQTIHRAVEAVMPTEALVISMVGETGDQIQIEYAIDRGGRVDKQVIPSGQGLSGWVIEQGISLLVDDLLHERRIKERAIYFGSDEPIRSLIAVPLRHHQQVLGMISAQSYTPFAYTREDLEWLEIIAANAAGVIQNARLYRQTQLRADEMAALLETTQDLSAILEVSSALRVILERITRLLEVAGGAIFLYDSQHKRLELAAVKNIPLSATGNWETGERVAARVAGERRPFQVENETLLNEPFGGQSPVYFSQTLGVPMICGGELIGVLIVQALSTNHRELTSRDLDLLQMFATHAASAVQVARSFDRSQQRLRELEVINDLSKSLRSAFTSEEIIRALLDETSRLFGSEAGAVWLYDPQTMKLIPRLVKGWLQEIKLDPLAIGEGLVGWVFEHGQPLRCAEFVRDERATDQFRSQARPGWGGIVMPIASTHETIGAFVIGYPINQSINEDELKIISAFCEIAGNALQRVRAAEHLERNLQRLMALRTIDNAINSSLDLSLTLDVLLEQVTAHVHADAVDILLYDPQTFSLRMVAQRGYRSVFMNPIQIPINNGILANVLNERRIQILTDLAESFLDNIRQAFIKSEGFRTYIALPLVAKGQIVGIMELFQRASKFVPPEELDFLETLSGQAAIAIDNANLFDNLQKINTQLSLAYDSTLEGWARALELRDNETEGHSRRVTDLTLRLAQALGVPETDLLHIRRGTLLHDIGKMGIPDEILRKPGPLSDEEWEIMRQHPVLAYQLLRPIQYLEKAAVIPYCHHERWDGSGYPQGLKGEQIPFAARIFAVVDVYDALTSDRPYRLAWSKEEAKDFLKKNAGKLFDPQVVDVFLSLID